MVAGIAVTEYMNQVAGQTDHGHGCLFDDLFENPTVDLSIAIETTFDISYRRYAGGLFLQEKRPESDPSKHLDRLTMRRFG